MDVKKFKKEELYNVAETLQNNDFKELINNLLESDDKTRYPSFLILQYRSEMKNDVYPYWDNFLKMLESDNSYFRTIGLKLIALNTKWDKDNKLIQILDKYLSFCEDEKMITARLCIQGLHDIINGINFNKNICDKIVKKLISINVLKRPNTNWKVMTTDIVNILIEIQKEVHYKEIIMYLNECLNNNIIDKKLKKEIEELLS